MIQSKIISHNFKQEEKEEYIEANILEYLRLRGIPAEKIVNEWWYDANNGFYRKRKSNYIRNGTSDIHGTIPPYGQALYIEVKKPSEMSFFDRTVDDVKEDMINYKPRWIPKKDPFIRHKHAIQQIEYLDEKRKAWAIAFFASSIEEAKERIDQFI